MMNLVDGDAFSLIAKKEDTHLQFRLRFKETPKENLKESLKRKIEVTGNALVIII
jgi:hypothetical protein